MAIEFVSEIPPATRDDHLPTPTELPDPGFDAALLRLDELQIDIEKIQTRVGMLFPFLTLDLAFLARLPQDIEKAAARVPARYSPRASASSASRPPLVLDDDALQRAIDASWSRRERWRTFTAIVQRLSTHSPHEGRAPALVRGYLDQNILQPYCDGHTRDPRYWAMLENAADHADFIDFVRSYARTFPSSKTTTELLFLLDELAQGSRDVVLMVMETRPDEDLTMTRNLAPTGYVLAVAIKERYGRWLLDRGWEKGEVRRQYNELRLRVLQTIIETTPRGYRRADAQFLAGQVLAEMNRLDDAIRVWRSIAPIPGDAYFRAYSEMLDVLGDGPPDVASIRRVLSAEYGRWRVYSIDRLRRFGHWCDTF